MKPIIVPFGEEMIPEAGVLLGQRHRHDRQVLPELPARFEDVEAAAAAVRATWQRPHASGVGAVVNDRLVGYLLGQMVFDQVWGRSGWVRTAGCAIDSDQDMELVRDLYAVLGEQWLEYGCFTHFAMMPVSDPVLVQMWFALSFGIEQVHALADLSALDLSDMTPPKGIEIRRAGPGDREALASLSGLVADVQSRGPVWAAHLLEIMAEQRGDWANLAEDPAWTVWLACEDGQPVACQGFVGVEPEDDGLFRPAQCAELVVAGTREQARGRGIGRALARRGMAHARANGFRYCETDWRSANLFASRFWPHRGFRPVVYRLVRRIDRRVAWARHRDEP